MKSLARFIRDDEGQDLVEYALLLAVVALAAVAAMGALGTAINSKYSAATATLAGS